MHIAVVHSLRRGYDTLAAIIYFMHLLQAKNVHCTYYLPLGDPAFDDWHYWYTAFQGWSVDRIRSYSDLKSMEPGQYDVFFVPNGDDHLLRYVMELGPVVCLNHTPRPSVSTMSFDIRPFQDRVTTWPFFVPRDILVPRVPQPVPRHLPEPDRNVVRVMVIGLGTGMHLDTYAISCLLDSPAIHMTLVGRNASHFQRILVGTGIAPLFIQNAPTHVLMRLLMETDYVLVPTRNHTRPFGAVNLAISHGKPLIMPRATRDALRLPSDVVAVYHEANDLVPLVLSAPVFSRERILAFRDAMMEQAHAQWSHGMELVTRSLSL
jgi:hypothetical protein